MKSRQWIGFVATGIMLTMLISSITSAYEDEGFQYWSAVNATVKLENSWKAVVEQEFRMGDDGGNLYYQHTDLGFVYSGFADWLDVSLNLRHIDEKDSDDKTKPENRPHINLTVKSKLGDFDLSNRARLEYRDRDSKDDVWRYRHKITLKFPVELTPLNLRPYVADDAFIDLHEKDFNKNRLIAGATFKLAENIKADIYYMWQATKTKAEWKDINVLGTRLKLYF